MKDKPVSLQDLANHVGLTVGTVSRALSDSPVVKAATRKRVREAARAIGYSPNLLARGLSSGRSGFIGISFSQFRNTIDGVFLTQLLDLFRLHAKRPLVEVGLPGEAGERETIRHFAGMRVDGVIFIGSSAKQHPKILQPLKDRDIPYIIIDRSGGKQMPDSIQLSRHKAYRNLTDYLIENGHRKIGLLGIHPELEVYSARVAGVREALRERSLNPDDCLVICAPTYTQNESAYQYGMRTVRTLIHENPRVTACFCSNDEVAVGAIRALTQQGLSVPKDLSVVGFDNLGFSAYTTPSLTTVDHDVQGMLKTAVDLLLARIRGDRQPQSMTITIEPRICIRESTGIAPKNKH